MAVGTASLPQLHAVAGCRLATISAGIQKPGRQDVTIIEICAGATVAGVFTQNAFCAAPVQIAKQHMARATPLFFIINTGNANAGTGDKGLADCLVSCAAVAELTGVTTENILPFSTGVIGELLPVEKITAALPSAIASLAANTWEQAAVAIMTTDTRPKAASTQFQFEGQTITVTGIAKGAGMLKPNMATMLGFIATDAPVASSCVDSLLRNAVEQSFNRITVDGDTSTNDACMLIATAAVNTNPLDSNAHALYEPLQEAITTVCIELAQGLVRDGEGASKFVTVIVKGGGSEQECLNVAYTVAESPLVKTALFASDPNWGRILAAIGRSDVEQLNVNNVSVWLDEILIAKNGCRADSYTEEQGANVMKQENISIIIDLARGQQSATVWTTDLSYDYVRINAEYRS